AGCSNYAYLGRVKGSKSVKVERKNPRLKQVATVTPKAETKPSAKQTIIIEDNDLQIEKKENFNVNVTPATRSKVQNKKNSTKSGNEIKGEPSISNDGSGKQISENI